MAKADDTVCIGCAFAQWDNITQTGCEVGAIDKFRERSSEVVECYNDSYEFYVIKNRTCPFKRTKAWRKHAGEFYKAFLAEENKLKIVPIVFGGGDLDKLKKTLVDLSIQSHTTDMIVIVNEFNKIIPVKDIKELMTSLDTTWTIDNQLKEMSREEGIVNVLRRFDKTNSHLAIFNGGDRVSQVLFESVHKFTIDELFLYGAITPDTVQNDYGGGTIFPISVFKYWYNNGYDTNILYNLFHWAEENKETVHYTISKVLEYGK